MVEYIPSCRLYGTLSRNGKKGVDGLHEWFTIIDDQN